MLPLLQLAARNPKTEVATPEAARVFADQFDLTEQERSALLLSGGALVFASRVSWACTYLKKAGLLIATRRGHFSLTDRGFEVLKAKPPLIYNEFLDRFEEFREFRTRPKKEGREQPETDIAAAAGVPEEVISGQYELQRKALAAQLLDVVKRASPEFFERLVVMLLVKMGYGGTLKDAGSVVGRSGDGGVDGVIKEDN